ncbi:MAG: arginyl-tRNA synthetase, partial [Candidatus Parvarchaeum acidophilus ARMAN-5]
MKLKDIKSLLNLPEWSKPVYSDFSDISFSCFDEAIKEGKKPKEFAEDLSKRISSEYIKSVEAMNGYINISMDFSSLNTHTGFLNGENDNSTENIFSGKNIRLEHTSVNPNKGLHIGHMRNSYIGEFMRRCFLYSSSNVITSNFIEDTGAQVADIIVGFKYLGKKIDTDIKFDLYCSKIYKEVNQLYESDSTLLEKRRKVLLDIENKNEETLEILEKIVDKVLSAQLVTLSGERIKYDLLDLERYILGEGIVKKALDKLLEEKIAFISESDKNKGCIVTLIDGKEVTLTRSDGTALYIAKDLAYAMIKHGILHENIKYKPFGQNYDGSEILISNKDGKESVLKQIDMSFTLTDSAQNAEQAAVKSIIEKFIGTNSYNHYSYEPVAISNNTASIMGIKTEDKFIRMSGRKGITVEFDDLITAVKKRIIEEGEKSGKDVNKEDALKVASSVIRYYILKFSPSKMVVFDINDATSLKGDRGLYINYSY